MVKGENREKEIKLEAGIAESGKLSSVPFSEIASQGLQRMWIL